VVTVELTESFPGVVATVTVVEAVGEARCWHGPDGGGALQRGSMAQRRGLGGIDECADSYA
jgi:hypothetical protein